MCLAVPGKIVSITAENDFERNGKVNFGGIIKDINLTYVPEAKVNDYVIVHVGFALSIVDEEEAEKIFEYLKEMDEIDELDSRQEEKT
jgi:hydrogenase expression/formation protein HypC